MIFDALKRLLGFAPPDPDQVEANEYATKITRELNRMGKCYVKKTKEGNIFQEVQFRPPLKVLPDRIELEVDAPKLPYGIGLSELKDSKIVEGIEGVLKKPVGIRHSRGAGFWYVVRRENATKPNFDFTDLRPPKYYDPSKVPLLVPIGRDDNGNQVWRDLEKIYHLLIGGATGKGKTSLSHCMICWLIQNTLPSHVKLILVDLKEGLDFSRYNGVPHLVDNVAITTAAAYEYLGWVDKEITRRGELFREVKAENIFTYRQRTGKFMNNIVFFFDEIANLGKLPPDQEAEAWFWLRDGSQRARALGIHFLISTQRPSVKIIDGDIKMNFTARIGLGTATDVDSRVILDNDMATGLEVGDLVYQDGSNRGVHLRGPYMPTDQADQIVEEVIRSHSRRSRRDQRAAELAAQKRQRLITRMLEYAVEYLDSRFPVEELFEKFGGEITLLDLKDLAKELEDSGVLEPARGRKPRTVVGFVGYRLSVDDPRVDAEALDDKNGLLISDTGRPGEEYV